MIKRLFLPCIIVLLLSGCKWIIACPLYLYHAPKIAKFQVYDKNNHIIVESDPKKFRDRARARKLYFYDCLETLDALLAQVLINPNIDELSPLEIRSVDKEGRPGMFFEHSILRDQNRICIYSSPGNAHAKKTDITYFFTEEQLRILLPLIAPIEGTRTESSHTPEPKKKNPKKGV